MIDPLGMAEGGAPTAPWISDDIAHPRAGRRQPAHARRRRRPARRRVPAGRVTSSPTTSRSSTPARWASRSSTCCAGETASSSSTRSRTPGSTPARSCCLTPEDIAPNQVMHSLHDIRARRRAARPARSWASSPRRSASASRSRASRSGSSSCPSRSRLLFPQPLRSRSRCSSDWGVETIAARGQLRRRAAGHPRAADLRTDARRPLTSLWRLPTAATARPQAPSRMRSAMPSASSPTRGEQIARRTRALVSLDAEAHQPRVATRSPASHSATLRTETGAHAVVLDGDDRAARRPRTPSPRRRDRAGTRRSPTATSVPSARSASPAATAAPATVPIVSNAASPPRAPSRSSP